MVLVHHQPEVSADFRTIRLLVQPGIESAPVELVVAQRPRVDAIGRGRLVEAHERVSIVPVASRGVPPVHHDDVAVLVRVDQRVGKGHAGRSRPDHQVVRLDGIHDSTPLRRTNVQLTYRRSSVYNQEGEG
jgi:hypothetical protein